MYLWPTKNFEFKNSNINNDFYHKHCYPCARQCITEYLKSIGARRDNYVATPEYLGNCVLNSINKISTTVPYKFINKTNKQWVNTILLYNQWGWERNQKEIDKIYKKYDNIILDRVDTLIDYTNTNNHFKNVKCEIFSLNKTLGIGGGGLLWEDSKYVNFKSSNQYNKIFDLIDIDCKNFSFIDHLQKNNFDQLSSKLIYNLKNNDLKGLINFEINYRKNNLKLLTESFVDQLPNWMLENCKSNDSFPGIFPIKLKNYNEKIIKELKDYFDLHTQFLNFNYSDDYLIYNWKQVLPIPLHSGINESKIINIINYIKNHI